MSDTKKSPRFWLMKSEPDVFSITDLKKQKKTLWEGVRNYQARNFMTTEMSLGDQVLFYHSNAKEPYITGITGLAVVCRKAMPDPTQFDKKSDYYDSKATPETPRWFCVEVEFKKEFKTTLSLTEIKKVKALSEMLVLKKGQRLSIQPVTEKDYQYICQNYS